MVPGHGEAGHGPGLRVVAPLEGGVRGQLREKLTFHDIFKHFITFALNTSCLDQVYPSPGCITGPEVHSAILFVDVFSDFLTWAVLGAVNHNKAVTRGLGHNPGTCQPIRGQHGAANQRPALPVEAEVPAGGAALLSTASPA